ncbi:MAG: hypothetical protein Q4F72_05870 [Desulfovibrionaceae bacterium]|nr:hypothetical protein [Desulfovibrionaceae bacterium]
MSKQIHRPAAGDDVRPGLEQLEPVYRNGQLQKETLDLLKPSARK